MAFENATPRPWRAEGPDMFGDYNIQGPVDALAIGAVVTNMRQEAEVAANAELIVTAVNAHSALVESLTEVMGWISNWDPNFIHDDEWPETRQRVEAALKLARAES